MPQKPAQPKVFRVTAVQIIHVPAVLTVHPLDPRHNKPEHLGFKRSEVPRVDYRRTQPVQLPPQAPVHKNIVPGLLAQLNDIDTRGGYPIGEIVRLGKADNGMPVTIRRTTIYDIDQTVLQPPCPQ